MSESILAILCHLLKGEAIITEKLAKEKETSASTANTNTTSASSTTAPTATTRTANTNRTNDLEDQGINSDHLQQLMDMGFARELALDALLQTNSLEQATDYLLSHPGPLRQVTVSVVFCLLYYCMNTQIRG
jgi:E3 ubiquitin-protein ligase HUWE1